MNHAPWYLRVAGVIAGTIGALQVMVWISELNTTGSPPLALLISGAVFAAVGTGMAIGSRGAYLGFVVTSVSIVVIGVGLVAGDQGIPPGNAVVGLPAIACGLVGLSTTLTPRAIRWARRVG